MHSSRMRTGRSQTVCWSLLPGGRGVWGFSIPGGFSIRGGSPSWGGVLHPGGRGSPSGGFSILGGFSIRGGASPIWGGVLHPGDMASQHALRQTPSPPCGQTDTCKNITLATTSLRPVITINFNWPYKVDPLVLYLRGPTCSYTIVSFP